MKEEYEMTRSSIAMQDSPKKTPKELYKQEIMLDQV